MSPEELAELWQNELSKDMRYKRWQDFTCEECDARVRVATTVLEKLAYERYMNTQIQGDLREQIFKALGEASMCWSETPQGVFDGVHAKEIGERLITAIEGRNDHPNALAKKICDLDRRVAKIESTGDELAAQAWGLTNAHAVCLKDLHRQVRRLNTEIFSTRITKHSDKLDQGTVRRQTLLGRVDELSGMAALGPVDQSFFLE